MTSGTHPRDLSSFGAEPPTERLRLLFIHHSCGGQLLAAPGPENGTQCIYATHGNGGDLRRRLEDNNYEVHEASYGSAVGEQTDLFDWLPKFRHRMADVLRCDRQDRAYVDGGSNRIVMFKSCYPNNNFRGAGTAPGNPNGPNLTVWDARAAFSALLTEFAKHPDVLFVYLTAPPLAAKRKPRGPLWKRWARRLLGRDANPLVSARWAREFNTWIASPDGWLHGYPLNNVAVFDYYHLLTGNGRSDHSAYPTRDGYDSHPSGEGNRLAAEAFVPFLNRAVRRAGLDAGMDAPAPALSAAGIEGYKS